MAPAPAPGSCWPRDEPAGRVRCRYVPLGAEAARRQHEEYAARRALFLQSYRFSTDGRDDPEDGEGEGLREARVAGRDAVARAVSRPRGAARWWLGGGAGLGRAWRGWRAPRVHRLLVGCFGPRHKYHLHDFVS